MKNYHLFELADFILDEDFIRWVRHRSYEDEVFWQNWLDKNPGKYLLVAEARSAVEAIQVKQARITTQDIDEQADRLMAVLKLPKQRVSIFRHPLLRIAAVLVLTAGVIAAVIFSAGQFSHEEFDYVSLTSEKQLVEHVNTTDDLQKIVLPDYSVVELSPNSRISYAANFENSAIRDVYLSGEAFFNVEKNPGKPFRVFANEIVTKVLGTSFTVTSFEKDQSIVVAVKTGKVSVYSQAFSSLRETAAPNSLTGIIVTPNQKIVYEKGKKTFEKELVIKPAVISRNFDSRRMMYEEEPIANVLNTIRYVYGINIVYDTELLKNCTLTADLTDESLYKKLDLLCAAIEAHYEIIDGQIFIQSSGCN